MKHLYNFKFYIFSHIKAKNIRTKRKKGVDEEDKKTLYDQKKYKDLKDSNPQRGKKQ